MANEHNNCQHCWRSSKESMHSGTVILKKRLQCACTDVFTRPTLLWFHANRGNVVAQRFAGHRTIVILRLVAPKLTGFKLYVLSANIVVVPCKRTQHVGPDNVASSWPTMLRPFAWAFRFTGSFLQKEDPVDFDVELRSAVSST